MAGLRNVRPPHEGGAIRPPLQARHEVGHVGRQVFAVGRHADPVHPGGPAAVHLLVRVAQKLLREVMGQGGEPLLRRRLRPMGDAFSSRVRVVVLLCRKGRVVISPRTPRTAFPRYAAFPRAEYYAVLRLLPALLPPSGLALGGHTLARPREVSPVPTAQLSAMPRSMTLGNPRRGTTPPRSPRPRLYRALVLPSGGSNPSALG